MAYDSALAQLTMNASNIVPKYFIPCQFVNLVYDNIDFKEDSAQQTHVTNGIIIQKVCNHDVQPVVEDRTEHEPIKKKQRTVALPLIGIKTMNLHQLTN